MAGLDRAATVSDLRLRQVARKDQQVHSAKMNHTREWLSAIEAFTIAQRAAGRPATTIATRRQHLRRMSSLIGYDPWVLTTEVLIAWLGEQSWAVETRRGYRNTLRVFYRWAVATGRCHVDPSEGIPVVRASPPNPRPLPDVIYVDALSRADWRSSLILRLGAEMGLRRAEVACVHSDDIMPDLEGYSLLIHGKGGKERVVPMPDSLASDMRALPRGWAFPGDDEGHLSPRWVGTLISHLLPDGWTMHKLRHRFATRAYAIDRDVFTVQELLGHASPATTRAYVKVPREGLRRTVQAAA